MRKFPQATLVWRLGCWCVALFPLPHPHRLLSCRFQLQFDFPGYTAHSWSTWDETAISLRLQLNHHPASLAVLSVLMGGKGCACKPMMSLSALANLDKIVGFPTSWM